MAVQAAAVMLLAQGADIAQGGGLLAKKAKKILRRKGEGYRLVSGAAPENYGGGGHVTPFAYFQAERHAICLPYRRRPAGAGSRGEVEGGSRTLELRLISLALGTVLMRIRIKSLRLIRSPRLYVASQSLSETAY
jgi:hypothetical protein